MAAIIKIKTGLEENLNSAGTTLGELKYTTDTNKLFIGNGSENKQIGAGGAKPYASLERLGAYLYKISFDKLPTEIELSKKYGSITGCSSFVKNGKLFTNLDWNYDNGAHFKIITKDFSGMTFIPNLNDGELDDLLLAQLPYHINRGRNNDGIMVSAHVLYNDFSYVGTGNTPLTKIPYIILSTLHSMDDISSLQSLIADIKVNDYLIDAHYLMHFFITDGITSYCLTPSDTGYELVDISSNPKLTNFKWVNRATVNRTDADIQEHATGIERFNMMPNATLEELRFTVAYENNSRLSEFIGINGTTKDSSNEELQVIYEEARSRYLTRTRNGETWQTCHSVVYSSKGIEHLYSQENYDIDYGCGSESTGVSDVKVDGSSVVEDGVASIDLTGKVNITDIVDDLESIASDKPLSANMGRELAAYVDDNITDTMTFIIQERDTEIAARTAGDNLRYTKTESDEKYVQQVSGKGLSTNDYTTAEKTKLAGLENYDDTEVRNLISQKSKVEDNHLTTNGTIKIDGTSTTVYDDTTIKSQLAGFNRNYVIDSESQITGTQDPTSKKWTNVSAIGDLDMTALKVGDNIYIKDDTVPDYWIVSAASGIVGLDPLDTKTDLTNYYNKTETDNLLSGKQSTITGAATTITLSNLTGSKVLVSNASGKVAASTTTTTELGYLTGATSNIQTQINNKLNNIVEITLSGSNGTLTSEQLAQIQEEPYTTIIILSTYKYRCIYMSSANIYYQRSITSSNSYISITVSTGAWSLTTTSLQTTGNLDASSIGTSTSKYPSSYAVSTALGNKQDKLVSETNIKSINGESILGSGGTDIPIGYYTCNTAAATAAKVGTWVSGAKYTTTYLPVGAIAVVKFTYNNTVSSPTLNLNSSGAKALMRYGTTAISTINETTGWYAGSVNIFTYDGTNWIRNQGHNTNSTYTIYYTTAYCSTSASTAAKVASCSGYVATANTFTVVTFTTANTSASALTLNINSQGAKTIYINGSISSSSNYTIPAGTYIVYYTGTYYYLRTDGRLPYLNNNVNSTYGISVDSSQRLYVVQASSSEIQNMNGSYKPVTPSMLPYVQDYVPMKLLVNTTAPTSANSYGLEAVYLTSEPSTKYAGYLYLIKE